MSSNRRITKYFTLENKSRLHGYKTALGADFSRNPIVCYPQGDDGVLYFTAGVKSRVVSDKPHFITEDGKYVYFVDQYNMLNICSQDPELIDDVLLSLFGDYIARRIERSLMNRDISEAELSLLGGNELEPYDDRNPHHKAARNSIVSRQIRNDLSDFDYIERDLNNCIFNIQRANNLIEFLGEDIVEKLVPKASNIALSGLGSSLNSIMALPDLEMKAHNLRIKLQQRSSQLLKSDIASGFEPDNDKVFYVNGYLLYMGGPLTLYHEGQVFHISDNIKMVARDGLISLLLGPDDLRRFRGSTKLFMHPHIFAKYMSELVRHEATLNHICVGDALIKWSEQMMKNPKREDQMYPALSIFDAIKSMLMSVNVQSIYFPVSNIIPMVA